MQENPYTSSYFFCPVAKVGFISIDINSLLFVIVKPCLYGQIMLGLCISAWASNSASFQVFNDLQFNIEQAGWVTFLFFISCTGMLLLLSDLQFMYWTTGWLCEVFLSLGAGIGSGLDCWVICLVLCLPALQPRLVFLECNRFLVPSPLIALVWDIISKICLLIIWNPLLLQSFKLSISALL